MTRPRSAPRTSSTSPWAGREPSGEFSPSALAGEPPWLALAGLTLADAHDGLLQCGVDVIEIPRIAAAIERWGQPILDRVWTPAEQRFCRGRMPELAARFAAKEAISKTLGTGIRGIRWREMEILPDRRGKPLVFLHGGAAGAGRRHPPDALGGQPDAWARPGDRLRRRLRRSGRARGQRPRHHDARRRGPARLVTAAEMRAIEARAAERGETGPVLMDRAARRDRGGGGRAEPPAARPGGPRRAGAGRAGQQRRRWAVGGALPARARRWRSACYCWHRAAAAPDPRAGGGPAARASRSARAIDDPDGTSAGTICWPTPTPWSTRCSARA